MHRSSCTQSTDRGTVWGGIENYLCAPIVIASTCSTNGSELMMAWRKQDVVNSQLYKFGGWILLRGTRTTAEKWALPRRDAHCFGICTLSEDMYTASGRRAAPFRRKMRADAEAWALFRRDTHCRGMRAVLGGRRALLRGRCTLLPEMYYGCHHLLPSGCLEVGSGR